MLQVVLAGLTTGINIYASETRRLELARRQARIANLSGGASCGDSSKEVSSIKDFKPNDKAQPLTNLDASESLK